MNYDMLDISILHRITGIEQYIFEGHCGQALSYLRDGGKNMPV